MLKCQNGGCWSDNAVNSISVKYGDSEAAEVQHLKVCDTCLKFIKKDCENRGWSVTERGTK